MALPNTITLIRHGEKPTKHNSDFGVNIHGAHRSESLSPTGWQRAGALSVLLGRDNVPAPFVRPTRLYSCGYPDNPGGEQHRPYETLVPLSRKMGLEIRVPVLQTETEKLALEYLLREGNEDVLVSWEHGNIPPLAQALAEALGISDLPHNAREWPDSDYSTALIFACSEGEHWQVQQVNEDLL